MGYVTAMTSLLYLNVPPTGLLCLSYNAQGIDWSNVFVISTFSSVFTCSFLMFLLFVAVYFILLES